MAATVFFIIVIDPYTPNRRTYISSGTCHTKNQVCRLSTTEQDLWFIIIRYLPVITTVQGNMHLANT